MAAKVILRKAEPTEQETVQGLVQRVGDETYGGVWAEPPLPIDVEDWSQGWVAIVDWEIAGVMLTHEDWLSDLWVLQPFRGIGIGALLLWRAEAEIAERKYAAARLRVVGSNERAQAFYARHGWLAAREFAHENLPITMIEMGKTLPVSQPDGPLDRRRLRGH